MPSFVARFGCHFGIQRCVWLAAMLVVIVSSGCSKSPDGSSSSDSDEVTPVVNDEQSEQPVQGTSAATKPGSEPVSEPESKPVSEAELKQQLSDAATQLWDARVSEDWPVVFTFQQFRSAEDVSVEQFAAWSKDNEPFVMRSYSINDVSVDGDVGWVTLKYESSMRQFPGARSNTSVRDELWQLVNDQWKLVPAAEYELYPKNPAKRDAEAELVLRQLFEESWQARVDKDWDKLYQMADPRDHAKIPLYELAEAKSLTIYLERDIEWVQVIGDNGIVRVAITHKINDPNLTKLPARIVTKNEQWIRLDGKWYMDLRPEVAN